MQLDLFHNILKNIRENSVVKNFISDLSNFLENFNNKNNIGGEFMDDINLTPEEELELHRKEFKFLQEYFKRELLNTSKGEMYLVTNKYENDIECQRYKLAQYKDNFECKYIAYEKDLPENVQLRDVVRKIDGKYIYDKQATEYVKDCINKIQKDIINKRNIKEGIQEIEVL